MVCRRRATMHVFLLLNSLHPHHTAFHNHVSWLAPFVYKNPASSSRTPACYCTTATSSTTASVKALSPLITALLRNWISLFVHWITRILLFGGFRILPLTYNRNKSWGVGNGRAVHKNWFSVIGFRL